MGLGSFFSGIIEAIMKFLPLDPFKEWIAGITSLPYLGYLNYFFPVSRVLALLAIWLTAIAVYLIWKAVLRWLNIT